MFALDEPETIDRLLAQIGHLQRGYAHRGMESMGLYRGQPPLLHLLWNHEGLTQTELANEMRVQPATVSKMVQRMERSGFVERRRDPNDERVSRVYLTDRGRAVKGQVEAWFRDAENAYLEGLSAEDLTTLRRLLCHIRDRLVSVSSQAPTAYQMPLPEPDDNTDSERECSRV